jgi:protocatechuate 3,4-dioxygenase beta subunit
MANEPRITRRNALLLGLGGAAAAVGGLILPRGGPATAGTPAGAGGATCDTTPAMDEGPFFPTRRPTDSDADLTRVAGRTARADGDVIVVRGRVVDEACAPIAGAVVDVWQANRHGRYDHEADPHTAPLDPNFQGSAHLVTGEDGSYSIRTIMPGAYPAAPGWDRPPHLHFKVARRGFHESTTQMLFAGHELNAADRLLQSLPAEEQDHLVVSPEPDPDPDEGAPVYTFELVLRRV